MFNYKTFILKNILGLILCLTLFSSTSFAMIFSQPVEIGSIGWPVRSSWNGIFVNGASYNDGHLVNTTSQGYSYYDKGIARFGDGENALYCRYKYGVDGLEFGGKEQFICTLSTSTYNISRIDSNEGITLYVLKDEWYQSNSIVIIGRLKNGKWVKYVDTTDYIEKYFSSLKDYAGASYYANTPKYNKVSCENDTVIIYYESGLDGDGEFRFKWDDKAQWFGIEKVVY